jgi:hypothetical protein
VRRVNEEGQALTIKGRPRRTVRCDVVIEGTTVVASWTWFEGDACAAGPKRRTERFADAAAATVYAAEMAEDLLTEGFREDAAQPTAIGAGGDRDEPSALDGEPHTLAAAIVDHCRERAWFGADMMLRFTADAAQRTRFQFAPATAAELDRLDRDPSHRLPQSDAAGRDPDAFEPYDPWPGRVVRLVDWGCAIWSCLDVRRGRVLRYEPLEGKAPRAAMIVEAVSFEDWLERWLQGDERCADRASRMRWAYARSRRLGLSQQPTSPREPVAGEQRACRRLADGPSKRLPLGERHGVLRRPVELAQRAMRREPLGVSRSRANGTIEAQLLEGGGVEEAREPGETLHRSELRATQAM